jgi:ABC-type bacteriocin/lantibiotic exporter with double-glycine peptidase domain
MLLAQQGQAVSEDELVEVARLPPEGLNPEETARVLEHYGLQAREEQLDQAALADLVARQGYPVVFVHRRPLDQEEMVHAVIPIRLSARYVTFLDPLQGERRVALKKFATARRLVGQWVVTWEPPAEQEQGGPPAGSADEGP